MVGWNSRAGVAQLRHPECGSVAAEAHDAVVSWAAACANRFFYSHDVGSRRRRVSRKRL